MFGQSLIATDQVTLVLVAVAYLQIKHFVCDFVLQRPYQYLNKGTYGHPGGMLHSGMHALATIPVFAIMTPSWRTAIAIMVAEFIVHYHIDWAKEQVMKHTKWQTENAGYWTALGMDQLLHQLTYLVIVAVLAGKFG